jgi:glycosyltransferase involved in cell wall biosynthesis
MRVTFVLPCLDLSGGVRVVSIYADRLQQLGHEVCVVAPPDSQPSLKYQLRSLLKGNGWIPQPEPSPSHFDGMNSNVEIRMLDRSRPIEDKDVPDADVVIATWWETAEWVAKFSPAKGAKAYFIQHYEAFDYLPKDRVDATWQLPMHKIVIAQWLVELAKKQFRDDQVSWVPNSVDTKQFYASSRGKQPIPTIGMLYATPYWKGVDISLKAFSLAAEKIPNLRLVAFGNHELVEHLPLPSGAKHFHSPNQSLIREVYGQCDAWLFGSRLEGFGLPILEAMACRTPVIGTPAGAAPELLTDGAGILVNLEDAEGMAKAIEHICHLSDADWQVMSELAYARASQYTWETATQKFEAALEVAIARTQQGDFEPTRKGDFARPYRS